MGNRMFELMEVSQTPCRILQLEKMQEAQNLAAQNIRAP